MTKQRAPEDEPVVRISWDLWDAPDNEEEAQRLCELANKLLRGERPTSPESK